MGERSEHTNNGGDGEGWCWGAQRGLAKRMKIRGDGGQAGSEARGWRGGDHSTCAVVQGVSFHGTVVTPHQRSDIPE